MADVTSRRHSLDNAKFLTEFSALFPPPQNESWTLFLFSNKVTSKVCSELLNQQSTLELWRRLPTKEYVFGWLEQTSSLPIFQHMTKSSVHCHNQNKSMCWSVSPNMCAPEAFPNKINMSVRKRSKYCYESSPRLSNWTDNKVWWLHRKENIIRKSANFFKGTYEKTHPQNSN
jgi:hypothetical protein